MRHDFGKLGDGIHQIFTEVIWMRSEEADTLDPSHFMDHAQKTREIRPIGDVFAVPVDNLTKQRYFLDALRGERTDLRDNIANGAAALNAAAEGDDAKGAGM
jgi:hypothetical protein